MRKAWLQRAVGHGVATNSARCLTSYSITTRWLSLVSTSYLQSATKVPGWASCGNWDRNELKGNAQYQAVLKDVAPQLEYDRVFAEKLKNRAIVLGYYFSEVRSENGKGRTSGALPRPVLAAGTFKGKNIFFTRWVGYGANLEEFQRTAASGGHFNPLPDDDGVTRRVPMLAEYDGAYYESLSMAMIRLGLGLPPVVPGFPDGQVLVKRLSGTRMDRHGTSAGPGGQLRRRTGPLSRHAGQFQIPVRHRRAARKCAAGRP